MSKVLFGFLTVIFLVIFSVVVAPNVLATGCGVTPATCTITDGSNNQPDVGNVQSTGSGTTWTCSYNYSDYQHSVDCSSNQDASSQGGGSGGGATLAGNKCGSADNGTFSSFPPDSELCHSSYTPRNKITTDNQYKWYCGQGNVGHVQDCEANRVVITSCGDGERQLPNSNGQNEQCDNGSNNGQVCTPDYGNNCTYCTNSCTIQTVTGGSCGNGAKEGSEQCDDGNQANGDGCSSQCKNEPSSIAIDKKAVNGSDSQQVVSGGTAKFKITVVNTGTTNLKDVVISDAKEPSCNRTAAQTKALYNTAVFAPGKSFTYTCETKNVTVAFPNVAKVDAKPVNGGNVSAQDPTSVTVQGGPAIKIDKNDADNGDDTQEVNGTTATYTVTVTNIGEVALKDVIVTDDKSSNCNRSAAQTKALYKTDIFSPGQSFTYTCKDTNVTEPHYSMATVAGIAVNNGVKVSDSDNTKVTIPSKPEPEPKPTPEPESKKEKKDKKCKGSIGNLVWNDKNDNGVQDANEAGIPGVRVWLYKGNKVYKDVTNSQGRYKFKNLCSGKYRVVVKQEDIASLYQVYDPDKKMDSRTKVRLKGHDDKHTKADFGYRGAIVPRTGPGLVLSILFAALAAGGGVYYYRRRMTSVR